MPVMTHWHDQANSVIRVEFSDPWTLTELSSGIQSSRQLMSSVDHTVDAIWDGTKTKGAPSNMLSHFMFPNNDTIVPPNQGAVIVIVNGMFLRQFAIIAKRLMPQITRNMHITTSLPDAEKKIKSMQDSRR
jgi:hypothetical protein